MMGGRGSIQPTTWFARLLSQGRRTADVVRAPAASDFQREKAMEKIDLIMTTISPGEGEYDTMELYCPLKDDGTPDFATLRSLIRNKLGGCDFEHVNVFWEGEYRDMFVDEIGQLKDLPINMRATVIYWNNVKVHSPTEYDPDRMPLIFGKAVIFDKKVWT